jgi:hypothetical protein
VGEGGAIVNPELLADYIWSVGVPLLALYFGYRMIKAVGK